MNFKIFLKESTVEDIRTLSAEAINGIKRADLIPTNILADYLEENCRNEEKANIIRNFTQSNGSKVLNMALQKGVKNGFVGFGGDYDNTLGTFIKIRVRMPYDDVIKNRIPEESNAYFEVSAYAPVLENVMQDLFASQKCFLQWTDEMDLARYVSLDPKDIVVNMERLPGYFGHPTMVGPSLIVQSWFNFSTIFSLEPKSEKGLLNRAQFKKGASDKLTYALKEPDRSVHDMYKDDLSPTFWNTIIMCLSSPMGTLHVFNDLEYLMNVRDYGEALS